MKCISVCSLCFRHLSQTPMILEKTMKTHHTIRLAIFSIILCYLPLSLSNAGSTSEPESDSGPAIHKDQRIPWIKPVIPLISTLRSNRSIAPPKPQPTPIETEEQTYKQAFVALKNAQYNRAITLYQSFMEAYPNSKYIAGSHLWTGEACFLSQDYDGALEKYAHVMIYFPKSLEAEQATLKSALTFYEMANWPRAQKAFKHVITSYPRTITAQKAQRHLKLMKKKGLLTQK
jgi:tol-pal system protein YbgF